MADKRLTCQECGCHCATTLNSRYDSLHLHQEIENLKKNLADRDSHIVQMETSVFDYAKQFPNGELEALQKKVLMWQEKYERLYDSHKKLQKVNQSLEDKLLKIVDKFETEKNMLVRDMTDLTSKLVETRVNLAELEEENEQYRNDCGIAVQLLQCKPSNFVSHKLSSLPIDLQKEVKGRIHARSAKNDSHPNDVRTIRVPIPTFPPTAMVYSVNNNNCEKKPNKNNINSTPDYVSAAIMAKVLEERAKERLQKTKTQPTTCSNCKRYYERKEKFTQTTIQCNCNALYANGSCHRNCILSRQRSESSSSSDSHSFYIRNGSSTETAI